MTHSINEPVAAQPEPAKKKKHIFRWFFLAVQALFLIWIIAGVSSAGDNADCGSLSAQTCSDATAVGAGIGAALIIGLWLVVDFLLAITFLIFRKK